MGLLTLMSSQDFFEKIDRHGPPTVGQIIWTPVPHLNPQPTVLEVTRQQDDKHPFAYAKWVPMTDKHFTRQSPKGLPILRLNLGETEEMIAFKAKVRPAVIVSTRAAVIGGLAAKTVASHHEENRLVVAPVYGLRDDEDPNGFSGEMATRVRHLMYPQFFPFHSWKEARTIHGVCSFKEGIVRFDRLQFVNPSPPGCSPVLLKFSEDALSIMHAMLQAYMHGEPSKKLVELREMLADDIPEEVRAPIK
jgi:hypothetical protein